MTDLKDYFKSGPIRRISFLMLVLFDIESEYFARSSFQINGAVVRVFTIDLSSALRLRSSCLYTQKLRRQYTTTILFMRQNRRPDATVVRSHLVDANTKLHSRHVHRFFPSSKWDIYLDRGAKPPLSEKFINFFTREETRKLLSRGYLSQTRSIRDLYFVKTRARRLKPEKKSQQS